VRIKSFTSVIIVLSSAIALLTSCAQGPSKETLDAVVALKKIQAGTQVGLNYQQYGQLLIEAKAKTNEAVRKLPDGSLKTELTGAMDAYADAATVWSLKIKGGYLLSDDSEPDMTLITKYHIPVSASKYSQGKIAGFDEAFQIMWRRADAHLVEVSKLVGQEPAQHQGP
jgi:hypothetical protein